MSETLDGAAATCLLPAFPGREAPDWIRRWLERGAGGVVLFARNIESPAQLAALTAQLRSARTDVLVASDEEGGDVTRLEAATGSSYPGHWALGVVDDPAATEAVASSIADDLASVGINLDFAPVADVNSNPDNPVIGIRSFGAEPALVARHVFAFVAGLQRNCVAACAKHFPGHGDTTKDSHLELPVVDGDFEGALGPFRAAINAGVRSIMTAHIRAPALGDEPATLSRRIVQELLRDELGYGGVVISDALEMQAISSTMGIEEGAVRALDAGVDALCLGAEIDDALVERVHAAVVESVRSGRLAESRLEEAATRVRELAKWASQATPGSERGTASADVARRALVVEGDVTVDGDVVVLELKPPASIAAGEARHAFADNLEAARSVTLTEPPADARSLLDGRRPVVVVRDAHRHAWEREAVEAVLAAAPDAIVVETGIPVWRPRASGFIATHGGSRASFAAAAEQLRNAAG